MYAEERHRMIAEKARNERRIEVSALSESFGVSPETIRRDLSMLERQGILRRTHGGAVPVEQVRFESEVAERLSRMSEEKARIAESAMRFVPSRGTILLDSGTTTGALARLLPAGRELTVVTNCLPIASLLVAHPSVTVLISGGRVRARTLAAVDDFATGFLENFSPDVAFVAANGVTTGQGLTTPNPAEAAVKRAMVRNGQRVILMADHSKVGQEHFVRFAGLDEIDVFVTDSGLDDEPTLEFEAAGVEVVRA